jgi:hypothetical protein
LVEFGSFFRTQAKQHVQFEQAASRGGLRRHAAPAGSEQARCIPVQHNNKQKMFLELVFESGYRAAKAFKSVNMDNIAMNNDMRKKLDEIRK